MQAIDARVLGLDSECQRPALSSLCGYGVTVYMAELEAPALRETARQFLEAEAGQLGIPLDPAEVLVRRAAGGTKMHVVAAARKLIGHLAATEADPLGSDSTRTP